MTIYPLMNILVSVLAVIVLIALLVLVMVKIRPGQPRTLASLGVGFLLVDRVWNLVYYQMTRGFFTSFSEAPFIINLIVSNVLFFAGVFLLVYAAIKAASNQVTPISHVQQPYEQIQQPAAQQPISEQPGQAPQYGAQPQYGSQPGYQPQEQQNPQPDTQPQQYDYQPQKQAPQQDTQDPTQQSPDQNAWAQPNNPYGQPQNPYGPPQG